MGGRGSASSLGPQLVHTWIHVGYISPWHGLVGEVWLKTTKKIYFLRPFPKSLVCHIMSLCSLGPQLVHTWIH